MRLYTKSAIDPNFSVGGARCCGRSVDDTTPCINVIIKLIAYGSKAHFTSCFSANFKHAKIVNEKIMKFSADTRRVPLFYFSLSIMVHNKFILGTTNMI